MRRSLSLFCSLFCRLLLLLALLTLRRAIRLTRKRHGNKILANGVDCKLASFAAAVKQTHFLCVVESHEWMFQALSACKPTCVLKNNSIYFVASLLWRGFKTIEICNGCCKLYVTLRV